MKTLKTAGVTAAVLGVGLGAAIGIGVVQTERHISQFQNRIVERAARMPVAFSLDIATLPPPVRRYFDFVFPDGVPPARVVKLEAEGEFRRPMTEDFAFTSAEQVIALRTPALMFSATTPLAPGIWARAYDFFADGEMEMRAKVMSLVTVVDEARTAELNQISLRRWLLESALYPQALLPGGPVRWEPIDAHSARAIAEAGGLSATIVAHFDEKGRMTQMRAEQDGDLTTPYHGSGEHVTRGDYRMVQGAMIPHRFIVSRAAGGELYPFFDAEITRIEFE